MLNILNFLRRRRRRRRRQQQRFDRFSEDHQIQSETRAIEDSYRSINRLRSAPNPRPPAKDPPLDIVPIIQIPKGSSLNRATNPNEKKSLYLVPSSSSVSNPLTGKEWENGKDWEVGRVREASYRRR